ncbi:hypothetical protein PDQ34_26000 [Bacillus cereus]|nr:hypothetical protein [Bacillus cereus]MDA2572669.1 hypothetical protein [Bacillus cereus]
MHRQKHLTIHQQVIGASKVYEFKTEKEAIEKMANLVECGGRPDSVRVAQELPLKVELSVNVVKYQYGM